MKMYRNIVVAYTWSMCIVTGLSYQNFHTIYNQYHQGHTEVVGHGVTLLKNTPQNFFTFLDSNTTEPLLRHFKA